MAQGIGMEALEWIVEAKMRCGILEKIHSWHWSVEEEVDSDLFPTLEGALDTPTLLEKYISKYYLATIV